jgi:YD repeat-containing protein
MTGSIGEISVVKRRNNFLLTVSFPYSGVTTEMSCHKQKMPMSTMESNTQKSSRSTTRMPLIIFLTVITFAIGCDQETEVSSCRVTKISSIDSYGIKEEIAHTFNADNKLIKWVSEFTMPDQSSYVDLTYEYTYDAAGKLIRATYAPGKVEYTYNDEGQVIKEEFYNDNGITVIIASEYNTSGQVIKRRHYDVEAGVATEKYYNTIEYATATTKNRLRSKRYMQDGTLISTTEYVYDNKKNPWRNIGLDALYGYGDNNVIRQTKTEGATTREDVFSYTYTQNGYPKQMTYSTNANDDTYTQTFTYNCN